MASKAIVIGAGFAGLAAASCLAQEGYEVTLLEKNHQAGGRARQFQAKGFTFDMGPSWYWMPEVFEQFFNRFNKSASDYYQLKRIDPSYIIHFGINDRLEVPASREGLFELFETLQPGSTPLLEKFLAEAAYKYEVGMGEFVHKPGHSIMDFADIRVVKSLFKLDMFKDMSSHVRQYFTNSKLVELLEFPVLFLGAKPSKTPALYSLMNHADLNLGTWYPMGGMHEIVKAMTSLARELSVDIRTNHEVKAIHVDKSLATGVETNQGIFPADIVIAGADYHHIEQEIVQKTYRQYDENYWQNRTMAPSSLLFYLGVNRKISGLHHHNLFFDQDFTQHAEEIYDNPKWPDKPLFYVCAPSVTDPSVAPQDMENIFVLIPVAPGLDDNEKVRSYYFNLVMDRFEKLLKTDVRSHIIYRRDYAHRDFVHDYHAYKGNAYGLANTLLQTAFLKPKMRSKRIKNMFYAGQLTTPGPGVPPSLISGQVAAKEAQRFFPLHKKEITHAGTFSQKNGQDNIS